MLRLRQHAHRLLLPPPPGTRAFLGGAAGAPGLPLSGGGGAGGPRFGGPGGDDKPRPMTYNFGGPDAAPDLKAACLSERSKDTIWQSYRDNPTPATIGNLAAEFRISRQRVHAIVWLREEQEARERRDGPASDEVDQVVNEFAEMHG